MLQPVRAHRFGLMCLFIGVVSAYDAYLVLKFAEFMPETEQNPIGRYLMILNGGDVSLFVNLKALGTSTVLATLAGMYRYSERYAYPVTTSLAGFQFLLLMYLNLC